MIGSLRTRLFITVALVLAASIAASSLLSRRATLVEVRTIVRGPVVEEVDLDAVAGRVEAHARAQGAVRSAALDAVLAETGRETGHRLLLVDTRGGIVSASDPELAKGRVLHATAGGRLSLDFGDAGRIELHGAPVRPIRTADGAVAAYLFPLRPPESGELAAGWLMRPWILATAAIAVIALVLTFALSRRILRPVSALTAAAERMSRGELGARVNPYGRDEISNLSRAFNTMADRIAETERLRRQMVSDVAHELRSPVTNLRCTLEAIQDGLTQPDRASIDALLDETLLLQRLIGDLQDLALAEAGRLHLHVADVDLEALVRRAAAMPAASGVRVPVEVDVAGAIGGVTVDADRLEQVMRNLLGNARTHTPPDGRITVRLSATAEEVTIAVQDTGRGIEPEHLPHVFDRFYRADTSRTRATGGAGLGLAIVRQFVLAHGGTVTAMSGGAGKGSTLTVMLPRRTASRNLRVTASNVT